MSFAQFVDSSIRSVKADRIYSQQTQSSLPASPWGVGSFQSTGVISG
ncbi:MULTISPECIES: hypothetical protein [Microcoleus]